MIVWKCCGYDAPIVFLFHLGLIPVFCMREYVHSNTGISSLYLTVCRYIRYRYPCSKAMDNTEHMLSAKFYTGVTIWVCKRVQFVIRSVNNLNTAR